jgi:hypothetical protein
MAFHPRRRVRRASLLRMAAVAIGLTAMFPAAAGAHGSRHLASAVAEQTVTGPPQEPTSSTPGTESPGEPPAPESPAVESSGGTRRAEARARRQDRSEECSVRLEATPSLVAAGEGFTLLGALSCPEAAGAVGETVTLYQKLAHIPGFDVAATTTSEAGGTFSLPQTGLEADATYYVLADGAKSARVAVEVTPQVTLSTPAAGTQLFVGGAESARVGSPAEDMVTFTGTVTPADAGTTVTLQREYRHEAWHRIASGEVDAEGSYTILHTFSRPGQARLRVVVHGHGLQQTSCSTPVTYEISRRSRQRVTIQASADPLAYGAAVTLTGTVAGAAEQPVKLLAQTPGGTFTQIAETTTSGGEYTFLESPLQSTRYRVTSGGADSTILPEGVTYALTVLPSAVSVEAGQPFSVTGTVAPALEGQVVALESQNSSGVGYHVIASDTLGSSADYSLTHIFATAGTELLRVRVTGNDKIETSTGETLKLEVTPA